MAHHAFVPDLVLASTATRVRETVDLVLPAFKAAPKVVHEPRIYEADPGTLLSLVQVLPGTAQSVLMVGHNPGLAELALSLVATGGTEARRRLTEKFPTGALAVIHFPFDDWSKVHPKSGRLVRFIVPRALKAEVD